MKQLRLKQFLAQEWQLWAIAPSAALFATTVSLLGLTQGLEWAAVDQFFRWRSLEPIDTRIVVVTIDDQDITNAKQWPISDATLAQVIQRLNAQQPRAIVLDLYRDLPVEPGRATLAQVFATTPNLVGAQKKFGSQQVPPPPGLAQLGQVAMTDVVEDQDGRVRRALLSAEDEQGNVHLSLGTQAALQYLDRQGVQLQPGLEPGQMKLGHATFDAIAPNEGGYINADTNGYQILLNYRAPQSQFQQISLSTLLQGDLPDNFVRDRIVFIGSTAASTNDFFLTPYDGADRDRLSRTSGVFIHANLASQIIAAALDRRPLIQTIAEPLEWLWTFGWCVLGVVVTWQILRSDGWGQRFSYGSSVVGVGCVGGGLLAVNYGLFVSSWWLPIGAPLVGLMIAAIATLSFHSRQIQRIAFLDGLTQVANRRYFDQFLAGQSFTRGHLSLILCDVDCFKNYNDTYGHQAGDACLQQVAGAILQAVRRTDVVARYGGEEFAVILPNATAEAAMRVVERILQQVRDLQLPHQGSTVQAYVTLSCGVVSVAMDSPQAAMAEWSPSQLIAKADEALYLSKKAGRDRYTVAERI